MGMPEACSIINGDNSIQSERTSTNIVNLNIDTKVNNKVSSIMVDENHEDDTVENAIGSFEFDRVGNEDNSKVKSRLTRHLSDANKIDRSHVTKSTNGEQRLIKRKDIKVVSPRFKRLSPKLSPKLKSTLIKSNKKDKKKLNDKNINKIEGQLMNKKVKTLISHFEANINVNGDVENADVKKGEAKDALEALMSGARAGDTHTKKTPVRKRVKRLENITSSNMSILDWVTKSASKGST